MEHALNEESDQFLSLLHEFHQIDSFLFPFFLAVGISNTSGILCKISTKYSL